MRRRRDQWLAHRASRDAEPNDVLQWKRRAGPLLSGSRHAGYPAPREQLLRAAVFNWDFNASSVNRGGSLSPSVRSHADCQSKLGASLAMWQGHRIGWVAAVWSPNTSHRFRLPRAATIPQDLYCPARLTFNAPSTVGTLPCLACPVLLQTPVRWFYLVHILSVYLICDYHLRPLSKILTFAHECS